MLLVNDDRYRILYRYRLDWFELAVLASPFEETRAKAEQDLLRLLGGEPRIACGLSVSVTGPTGEHLPLSLCPVTRPRCGRGGDQKRRWYRWLDAQSRPSLAVDGDLGLIRFDGHPR